MASLIETNKYLRDSVLRERMLRKSAYDSSVFEGAKGLPKPQPVRSLRKTASSKKRAKG